MDNNPSVFDYEGITVAETSNDDGAPVTVEVPLVQHDAFGNIIDYLDIVPEDLVEPSINSSITIIWHDSSTEKHVEYKSNSMTPEERDVLFREMSHNISIDLVGNTQEEYPDLVPDDQAFAIYAKELEELLYHLWGHSYAAFDLKSYFADKAKNRPT